MLLFKIVTLLLLKLDIKPVTYHGEHDVTTQIFRAIIHKHKIINILLCKNIKYRY